MFETRVLFHIYVMADEGGFAVRAKEPGGGVSHGITLELLAQNWKRHGKGVPTMDDLKALTVDEASAVYDDEILDPLGFDRYPAGLDYLMANTATMEGVHGATKLLQDTLDLPITGVLDEAGWAAVERADVGLLAAGVMIRQLVVKLKDPDVGAHKDAKTGDDERGFGPGWGNRDLRDWEHVEDMLRTLKRVQDMRTVK